MVDNILFYDGGQKWEMNDFRYAYGSTHTNYTPENNGDNIGFFDAILQSFMDWNIDLADGGNPIGIPFIISGLEYYYNVPQN